MNFKKCISFILLLIAVFCLSKNFFMSYAAETSGYVVLLNNEYNPISFAGMKYVVDDDLKNVSIEFQVTDSHLFKGKQGVILTVICGDQKDTIHIDSDSDSAAKAEFFSLDNVFTEINSFDSHTNVKINFDLTFDEKLKDELLFKVLFTDAVGAQSEEAYCVLYSPAETTNKTTKPKESTTYKLSESSSDAKQTSEKFSLKSTEHYQKHPNSGNNYYNDVRDSTFSPSQHVSDDFSNDTVSSSAHGLFSDQKGTFGLRQIVAVTLAVFLVAVAVVYIIIGIKRNKVE